MNHERRKSVKGLRRFMGAFGLLTVLKAWGVLHIAIATGADIAILVWVWAIYKSCERV